MVQKIYAQFLRQMFNYDPIIRRPLPTGTRCNIYSPSYKRCFSSYRIDKCMMMSKRSRSSSGEDRINELPDHLLLRIMSRYLTLKEAVQTSSISRRWKMLWMFIYGDLDFDVDDIDDRLTLSYLKRHSSLLSRQNKKDQYVNWVNQVLRSHQGLEITCLRVCFDLDNDYKSDLDTWIEFALLKKTWNLIVDLSAYGMPPHDLKPYPFPRQIFSSNSNIKILRYLELQWVDVTGLELQDIFLNCTALNSLRIIGSKSLVDANICGQLKLKRLEIRSCIHLKTVRVSAVELEWLIFIAEENTSLSICHAPKLHRLHLGGGYLTGNRIPAFSNVPTLYSQIDTLVLDSRNTVAVIADFPVLKNVKSLEVKVATPKDGSLLSLVSVIKAFPMLRKLVVEFSWELSRDEFASTQSKISDIQVLEKKLERLKEVEFNWFRGLTLDAELAMSLLKNAPNVESLVFDVFSPTATLYCWQRYICSDEDRMAARDSAHHLAANHSPKARLLIN